jgi:hypothetical protein
MAGVASETTGVIRGDDLRESFGLGAVGFVAARTKDRGVELGRLNRGRVVGVFGLGSVAGFAGDHNVLTQLFLIDDIGVAGFAHFVTCVGGRPGSGFRNGVAAIVPVLAETVGHNGGAEHYERDHCDYHHSGKTDQVFGVFEQVVCPSDELPTPLPKKTAILLDTGIGVEQR